MTHQNISLVDETTSLLGAQSQQEDLQYDNNLPQNLLLYPTSSEVIEATNVLFRPDFRRNDRNDFGSSLGGGGRRNRIAVASNRRRGNEERCTSMHQIILEECGIAEISSNSYMTRFTNVRAMIGTITTTSVVNLVLATPSIGGIGMIILPGVFANVGWLEGTLLFLASGILSAASLFLLEWICETVNAKGRLNGNSHHHNPTSHHIDGSLGNLFAIPSEATASYEGVVKSCLGMPGSILVELSILLHCLGQMVAYTGALSSQIFPFFSLLGIQEGIETFIWITSLGIIFPLSIISEDSAKMKFGGIIGTVCMMYIASVIVFENGLGLYSQDGDVCSLSPESSHHAIKGWVSLLQNAPIFLFVTNMSGAYVPVRYQQMTCLGRLLSSVTMWSGHTSEIAEIPNQESSVLVWTSLIMAGEVYLVATCVAYAAHCDSLPENVLEIWPITWIPGLLARLFLIVELVVISVGFLLPMSRASLWRILLCGRTYNESPTSYTLKTFVATVFLVIAGAFGSLLFDGALVLPLAITSAVCGTAQMFVIPAMCALALLRKGAMYTDNPYIGTTLILAFVVLGCGFGFFSLLALLGELA